MVRGLVVGLGGAQHLEARQVAPDGRRLQPLDVPGALRGRGGAFRALELLQLALDLLGKLSAEGLAEGRCERGLGCWGGGGALERKVLQRRPQRQSNRRLEGVAKAVGGSYCRLQMPLQPALAAKETGAGHRLGPLDGGGGVPPPLPMHPREGGLPTTPALCATTKGQEMDERADNSPGQRTCATECARSSTRFRNLSNKGPPCCHCVPGAWGVGSFS